MFVDISGNRLLALSFGSGPRTFFAHSGWLGTWEDWIPTLSHLSASWRTVAFDHRGTGESTVPVDLITRDALVDDLFRVMDEFNVEKCVLGGFSAGTVIALLAYLKA